MPMTVLSPRSLLLVTTLLLSLSAVGRVQAQPAPESTRTTVAQGKQVPAVLQEWRKYKAWLRRNVPAYHAQLNGPATLAQIQALEAELGVKLPEDFKQLYLENNGEQDPFGDEGSMLGHSFLSLQQISFFWKQDVLPGIEGLADADWQTRSFKPGTVQDHFLVRQWIPLFTDTQGDFLGYDFAPGPKGQKGQIINFGTREYVHHVIARDLTDFLRRINAQLAKTDVKKAVFTNEKGTRNIFGFSREGHLTDDLVALKTRGVTRDVIDGPTKVIIRPAEEPSAPVRTGKPTPVPIPAPEDLRAPVLKK
ncbi:SMI1/KNR4 family protein [Corallococcus exercitus]|uniref:SMI1/KNR4 family protein n=1 Tax=Corallococcus exercitus TaxID=2316736 RepID=UPI0035D420AA